ncbi:glycosyltransferase family 2 protein [Pseudoalteromonas sp. SSDWG2]|uniref:glycosyltransferase family 2 protein n=1 Tax=Pseudoalteromonas sp. SSDWG2 TaxID=3139391 RepID=UPI003BAA7143
MKTPISAFLITCNEQAHIREALEALVEFDEVIVVDSGSEDDTVAIAKECGAKVYHQPWLGFAKQKNYAMSLCRNDWVINVDGDEILSAECVSEVQSIVDSGNYDAIRMYFEDEFWGAPMHPKSKKRSITRIFKRSQAQFPLHRKVHENIQLPSGARLAHLSNLVYHYGYNSTEFYMYKQNCYSGLKASEKFEASATPSIAKLLLVFPLTFIKMYVLKKSYKSGVRGFVHSMINAMYSFLKEAKLFELTYRNNRKS